MHIECVETRGILHLTVVDDGKGPGNRRSIGVGLTSMRDRAEELGGTVVVEPSTVGGTRVEAVLPYRSGDLEGLERRDDGAD